VKSAPGVHRFDENGWTVACSSLVSYGVRRPFLNFDGVRPLDKLETENKLHCCRIDGRIRLLEPEPGLHP
jgi:hypothetical protein